ncbi:class I SAM-dependent methyltransferase [Parvularcula oceani]|uniref:class I SAM-dependent methyltransferase n=1 Tax=Parvularcula oceani TaxID=1247963 RepID=UPI0004E20201|nr:class I SAM-dependent methyltransferase [Parvularcula oceani]
MGFYGRHVEPRLVNLACGASQVERYRAAVVPQAGGTVLEVGFGSGLNLPHYDASRVDRLFALEPNEAISRLADDRMRRSAITAESVRAGAEAIPLPDASVDTVLVTFTLCTVPNLGASLSEIRRVTRPGGRLLFAEHGLAPDEGVRRWQRRVQPVWGPLAGGCHLTRDVPSELRRAGFALPDLAQGYARGAPRIAGYISHGAATPA